MQCKETKALGYDASQSRQSTVLTSVNIFCSAWKKEESSNVKLLLCVSFHNL